MSRKSLLIVALFLFALGTAQVVRAHCEVPCGIYDDQQRFDAMLEDQTTIEKAMGKIAGLAGKTDAQSANQLGRWSSTKESHATHTQHVIAQYFMTQRIKASDPKYVDKLTRAHAVMVAAMKCKQTVDPAAAATLKQSILDFHKAYTAK